MSQPIRGQGVHFVFPIGPKNTNLVEDVEILLPVNFRWIPTSGFRGEVENVSANQTSGWPSCFSDRPEKHKLGTGHWDLASCQVSLNSVQHFQRRSRKCLSQSEARAAILIFPIGPKHTLGRGRWDLASYQVSLNFVQLFQRRSRKCPSQSEAKAAILFFPIGQKKKKPHKLGRGRWDLASCQVSLNSVKRFQRRSRKCLSKSEAMAAICFSDQSEKHKLGRERWDLAPRQVSLNSVERFQRRSRKCPGQSEARAAILFFRSDKNTNVIEDVEILLPVKFRWIPFSGFREEVENVKS